MLGGGWHSGLSTSFDFARLGYDSTQGLLLMMMPMLIISGTLISATRCSWRVEVDFHGLPLKTFLWIKTAHHLTFCCCSPANKDNFIVGHSRYWLLIPIYTSVSRSVMFIMVWSVDDFSLYLSFCERKCWPGEKWKTWDEEKSIHKWLVTVTALFVNYVWW